MEIVEDYEGAVAVINGVKNNQSATLQRIASRRNPTFQAQIHRETATEVLANTKEEQASVQRGKRNARPKRRAQVVRALAATKPITLKEAR